MMHRAYTTSQSLAPGVQVSIVGSQIHTGDDFAIEYPNDNKATATVVSSEPNILVVTIGDAQWRLAPLAPHRAVLTPFKAEMAIVVWVVQRE